VCVRERQRGCGVALGGALLLSSLFALLLLLCVLVLEGLQERKGGGSSSGRVLASPLSSLVDGTFILTRDHHH
jgi:hypothetical protein